MASNQGRVERILLELDGLAKRDINPFEGRLFAHTYLTGDEELDKLVGEAYLKYLEKNMLNFIVYPSILEMERYVVGFVKQLFNAEEEAGTYTYGGTESIFLALYTAKKILGRAKVYMGRATHPAVHKAADILGLETNILETGGDGVSSVEDAYEVVERRSIIVASTPNYPYGTLDPFEELSKLALETGSWLHIDACIGFPLPFLQRLGYTDSTPGMHLEGVSSLSVDLHKYGYTPKGGSILLMRRRFRDRQIYVYSRWPGYPLVNTTLLSSRSAGPLAAAYAVIKYLGVEGYLEKTRILIEIGDTLRRGLERLGFKLVGTPVPYLHAYRHDEADLFRLVDSLLQRGWYVPLHPGSKTLGIDPSLHFTLAPIHRKTIHMFLRDVEEVLNGDVEEEGGELDINQLVDALINEGRSSGVNRLIYELDPDSVEDMIRYYVDTLLP